MPDSPAISPSLPDTLGKSGPQTPVEDNSVYQEARGNLSFLMSVIRCGEMLSPDEEGNVHRVIDRLYEEQKRVEGKS